MDQTPIDIRRDTSHLQPNDISGKVSSMVERLQSQFSLTVTWDEPSKSFGFSANDGLAKGTNGYLQIGPGWIHLIVRLPMMLQIQKASIEKEVVEVLDTALAA